MNSIFDGPPYSASGFENRRAFSINWNANRIDTPYLIQVADREYQIAIQNYNALRDAGRPVEMHIFPDEYHVKWQPAHRLTVYNRNVDWFNFWLRGVEDPDPAKAEQYVRWRGLCRLHAANLAESGAENSEPPCLAAISDAGENAAGDAPSETTGDEPALVEPE